MLLLVIAGLLIFMLGLNPNENTVEHYVITNDPYATKKAIENAASLTQLSAKKDVYVSIYFIESPIGTPYTVKWYLDDQEIQAETKPTPTDQHCAMVYTLSANKLHTGVLKFEILYKDDVLCSKELTVQ